jgi:hypothetical protein
MNGLFGNVKYEILYGRRIPVATGKEKIVDLKYAKYQAFLWLLTCNEDQFDNFMHNQEDSLIPFLWAYNYLLDNLCKER